MWSLVLLVCIIGSEHVVQGGDRVVLKNSNNPSNPCEGHVKIYRNKIWGYVGDTYWNRSTEEVVCRNTRCGQPLQQSPKVILIPTGSKVWLNEMACTGKEKHLWECSPPGWGISNYQKYTVRNIKCSDEIKITLDGSRCSGAVQYSINGALGYFCSENWRRADADRVCESLSCGKSKEISQQDWMFWEGFQAAEKAMIDCSDIEEGIDHLWQCVTQTPATCNKPAFVICEGHEKLRLFGHNDTTNVCSGTLKREANGKWESNDIKTRPDLWCQQVNCGTKVNHTQKASGTEVTCSDTVAVQLVDDRSNPSNCYGRVSILLNGLDHSVCNTNWNPLAGKVVCQELKCGKVIASERRTLLSKPGIMDHVNCSGHESSLWHCEAKHDKLPPCSSSAYVVCEKSLDVRLQDGPGKCAGRVEILYQGEWRKVSKNGWTDNNSDSVCRQLECGGKRAVAQAGGFSQGSGALFPLKVDCKTGTSDISDCIKGSIQEQRDGDAVGLICEDHKVVFLKENTSCSGLVGIQHGSKTYWLSGSSTTWNNDTAKLVCQQMHCGSLVKHSGVNANSDMQRDVWKKSVTCSDKNKSLFECVENKAAPDHNETIANVICSGSIALQLTNRCWGNVNVSMGEQWGGVCEDAWTEDKSKMLCKDLGCGDNIPTSNPNPGRFPVILKSLHETKQATKLSQYNFVTNNETGSPCKKGTAFVLCSGGLQFRLTDTRDTCSGNVEVFYGGQWFPVCETALSGASTQNNICQELKCGQTGQKIAYVGHNPGSSLVISELSCPAGLKKCSVKSATGGCTLIGLQCSNWNTTALLNTCTGPVMRHTGNSSAFDTGTWTEERSHNLCKSLNCGNMRSNNQTNSSFPAPQTVIECDEKPNVTLSGNCTGGVRINNIELCSTTWKEDYSDKVCHQLGCSNAVPGVAHVKNPSPNAEYYHVTCDSFHTQLGQCKRYMDKCRGKLVSVSCVKSVRFKTTQHCGGALQVNYQDEKWENVCPLEDKPPSDLMNMLCRAIGCGYYNKSTKFTKDQSSKSMNAMINYTNDYLSVKHCVRAQTCGQGIPAYITCGGYTPPPTDDPAPPVPIVSIMLGVGVVLILIILAVVFVRIWFIKKRRNTMKHPSRMLSQHEMEFDSGEFEQIKEDEMESFTHNRFRAESEVIMENNRLSTSSLPYDDVDEVARPLTAPGSSGGDHLHGEADGPTYEVEDPHESYDDVDAGPDITHTKAEVHDGSHPEPEGPAAESHQVQQDGDYLVPGQDR